MAYVIGDFSFETEEDAREAQKEVQAISYIMKQIDNEDPKAGIFGRHEKTTACPSGN